METDRLLLRAWTEADVDFVLDMYSRWDVQRFIGLHPKVMGERAEAVAAITRWRTFDGPATGVWAVQSRRDASLLGTLLLKPIPASSDQHGQDLLSPSGDTEIGWHFHPDAWGHGYATEAATRVLAHAFTAGLGEVVAVTNPANTASQAVATRIGMTHHGQTVRYYNAVCELFTATSPHVQDHDAAT